MALSINQILAATKIEGLELAKVASECGNYFVATYKGWQKTILVHAIAHMDRRQWIEALLSFVTEVMQDAPGENTFRPEPEAPVEQKAAMEHKPSAVKLVYNVDGSISLHSRRKLVDRFEDSPVMSAQDRVDSFLAGWFGDNEPKVRVKFRLAAKSEA